MRSQKIFDVFLSGPSDVNPELRAVKAHLESWSNSNPNAPFRFVPFVWLDDTIPEFSQDAQQSINKQIPEYDIFIGIMWTRIGSPTPRNKSGAIEEYREAINRHLKNSNIKVLFLFKNLAVPLNQIDASQISKLNEFKTEIGNQQLYKVFETDVDLLKIIEKIISSYVSTSEKSVEIFDQSNVLSKKQVVLSDSYIDLAQHADEEDIGFFEAEEKLVRSMQEVTNFFLE